MIILNKVDVDVVIIAEARISVIETMLTVDRISDSYVDSEYKIVFNCSYLPKACDEVGSVL